MFFIFIIDFKIVRFIINLVLMVELFLILLLNCWFFLVLKIFCYVVIFILILEICCSVWVNFEIFIGLVIKLLMLIF